MAELGITLAIAQERLEGYLAAEKAVLGGQSFRFADGRERTMADLAEIRAGVEQWNGWVERLNPVQRVLPARRAVGRVRGASYRLR